MIEDQVVDRVAQNSAKKIYETFVYNQLKGERD
jgi:hypothetical protein